MMKQRQATLIQDVLQLQTLLEPCLQQAMAEWGAQPQQYNRILTWIIEEELELIHMLFSRQHIHNDTVPAQIHQRLDVLMHERYGHGLSVYMAAYVRAPHVYDDNQIEVFLTHRDLYIIYYGRDLDDGWQQTNIQSRKP